MLQIAQTRRVGGRNIDREIIRDIREGRDPARVIIDAIARVFIGAEIDPHDTRPIAARGQARVDGRMSLAWEAETVDHRLIASETKEARTRIALLRQRRDCANLGKAKTQP